MAGTLRELRVGPGRTVSAGAPLFEVVDAAALWVESENRSVAAAAVVLGVVGIDVAGCMPAGVSPGFAPPLVEVQTEAPGLSTEEVESCVTLPLQKRTPTAPQSSIRWT
jgi:Cu/Ag efflux pump CusA